MPAIKSAAITAFYLFDVADDINLAALRAAIGASAASAPLIPKSNAPSYFHTRRRRSSSMARRLALAISTAFVRASNSSTTASCPWPFHGASPAIGRSSSR